MGFCEVSAASHHGSCNNSGKTFSMLQLYTYHSLKTDTDRARTLRRTAQIFCKIWQYWVQIFQEYVRRSAQSHLLRKYKPLVGSTIFPKTPKTSNSEVMGVHSERLHTRSYLPIYRKWDVPIRKHPFRFFRSVNVCVSFYQKFRGERT